MTGALWTPPHEGGALPASVRVTGLPEPHGYVATVTLRVPGTTSQTPTPGKKGETDGHTLP